MDRHEPRFLGRGQAQRVTLDRNAERPAGTYRFRLYERTDRVRCAALALRGAALTERDELAGGAQRRAAGRGPGIRRDRSTDLTITLDQTDSQRSSPVMIADASHQRGDSPIALTSAS